MTTTHSTPTEAIAYAKLHGTAIWSGTIAKVENHLKYIPEFRTSEPSTLRPLERDQAPPRSHSASSGHGAQRLHTDGANHRNPPDFIALCVSEPSTTPTLLWQWKWGMAPKGATDGMFVVAASADSFLAPALRATHLRFDPGCMSPGDPVARAVAEHLKEQSKGADVVTHEWTNPDEVLILNNRRILHGRAAVKKGDEGRELHRLWIYENEPLA